jgi:hypothetical protein
LQNSFDSHFFLIIFKIKKSIFEITEILIPKYDDHPLQHPLTSLNITVYTIKLTRGHHGDEPMYPVEESEGVNMLLSKEVTLRKRKNEAYWHLREALP